MLLPALLTVLVLTQPAPAACADVAACRQAALDAAAAGEFERFHDLAWRAVQKGRANDPALMFLLARAQSLSGRPGDALVMLRRLAGLGAAVDVRDDPDFARVRALAGWSEVAPLLAGSAASRPSPERAAPAAAPAPPAAAPAPPSAVADALPPAPTSMPPPGAATPDPAAPPMPAPAAPAAAAAASRGETTIALNERGLEPVGLAYDRTSRRFIVGDRRSDKLMVADEVFDQVNDLIGAASAGFGRLEALEIDGVRGDLWVASARDGKGVLHKLQLVSGRVLATVTPDGALEDAAFSDLTLDAAGRLIAADQGGSRLLAVNPASGRLERACDLPVRPVSIAAAAGRIYAAHAEGLMAAQLPSGKTTGVTAADADALRGLARVRAHEGTLVALRRAAAGRHELVRLHLSPRGTRVARTEALDPGMHSPGTALTIMGNAAYYVAEGATGPVIRRVRLR